MAFFKARPSLASLSPEDPPVSHPVWGQREPPLSTGGHRVDPDHQDHHVLDVEGCLGEGSLAGWCGHAVPVGACQEGWEGVVP